MKFLVTATLTDQAVLDKLADWMREQQQAGRIMAAYGLVGGGGYLSFDIKPLIDLDTSFAMGRNQLPA